MFMQKLEDALQWVADNPILAAIAVIGVFAVVVALI